MKATLYVGDSNLEAVQATEGRIRVRGMTEKKRAHRFGESSDGSTECTRRQCGGPARGLKEEGVKRSQTRKSLEETAIANQRPMSNPHTQEV